MSFLGEYLVHVRHKRKAYEVLVGESGARETKEEGIHGRNTGYGSNLAIYHKRTYYMGIKVFNILPSYIDCRIIKNSNDCLRTSFSLIPYIYWMNILNTRKNKTHYEGFEHILHCVS